MNDLMCTLELSSWLINADMLLTGSWHCCSLRESQKVHSLPLLRQPHRLVSDRRGHQRQLECVCVTVWSLQALASQPWSGDDQLCKIEPAALKWAVLSSDEDLPTSSVYWMISRLVLGSLTLMTVVGLSTFTNHFAGPAMPGKHSGRCSHDNTSAEC